MPRMKPDMTGMDSRPDLDCPARLRQSLRRLVASLGMAAAREHWRRVTQQQEVVVDRDYRHGSKTIRDACGMAAPRNRAPQGPEEREE